MREREKERGTKTKVNGIKMWLTTKMREGVRKSTERIWDRETMSEGRE